MAISAVKPQRPSTRTIAELDATISRCADLLSWPIAINAEGVFLPASHDIVGLTVPAGLGGEVNTEIVRREIHAPIVAVPGKPCRWVFLVQPPTSLPGLPVSVGLMSGNARIPLPPTEIGDEPVRWICEPSDTYRVVVPTFNQVLQAIRYIVNPRPI